MLISLSIFPVIEKKHILTEKILGPITWSTLQLKDLYVRYQE